MYVAGNRIRETIAKEPFQTEAGLLNVTISIGGTVANKQKDIDNARTIADNNLYIAKETRNTVVVSPDGATEFAKTE